MESLILLAVIHWLHVFCSVFWFGGSLYNQFVLLPILTRLPQEHQVAVFARTRGGVPRNKMTVVAVGTIVLGIIRGLIGGVQNHLDTPYGMTFLASLIIGLGMLAWKIFILDGVAAEHQKSQVGPEYTVIVKKWFGFRTVYMTGFFVLFTLMIAMRFGY